MIARPVSNRGAERTNPDYHVHPKQESKLQQIILISLGMILVTVAIRPFDVIPRLFGLDRSARQLTAQVEMLQSQNNELRNKIRVAHSLPYVEKVARERIGLVKPGELVLVPSVAKSNHPSELTVDSAAGNH